MTTYVLRDGKLVEKHLVAPRYLSSSAPSVISDTITETKHMGTGRVFTSKAKFRAETKAIGAVEVGNDSSYLNVKPRQPIQLDRGQRRDAIRQAFYEARNGRR